MDEFLERMELLRTHIDDADLYDKFNPGDWLIIWASMDALEDTHDAISAFVPSTQYLPDDAIGERYLHAYGVMQAFVIQQDAIVNLVKSLGSPIIVDVSRWARIRGLRVASVGHPTLQNRAKPASSHFISRITLDHRGFQLLSEDATGKVSHRFVHIPDLAREQETYILEVLKDLDAWLVQNHPAT